MKAKRLLSGILMMSMCAAMLSGCGKSEDEKSPFVSTTSSTTQSSTHTTTTEKTTEEEKPVFAGDMNTSATIEETVLVDEQGIKITATELTFDKYDAEVKLLVENNSDTEIECYACTLGYSCNAVNGYMITDGYFNAKVAPGKKSNESVKFDIDELLAMGITEISDIQIGIRIEDDGSNDLFKAPCQIKTSLYDSHDYTVNYFEQALETGAFQSAVNGDLCYTSMGEVYNNSGVQILSEIGVKTVDGDFVLLLEVVNTGTETVSFRLNNIIANDLVLCDSCWSSDEILPGCVAIIPVELNRMLDDDVAEVAGISDYSSVSYDVELRNLNGDTIADNVTINTPLSDKTVTINMDGEVLYDENGITIIGKGVIDDSASYSEDIHWIMLVINNTNQEIYVDEDYDSLSANGFMLSDITVGSYLMPGTMCFLDVDIMEYSLEENGIAGAASITEIETNIKIRDENYYEINNIPVKQTF